MNKKFTSLLLVSIAGVCAAQAQDYRVSTDVNFASEYVFRGQKEAGPTLLPSVEVHSVGNPAGDLYLGGWAATPARDEFENEINAYAGFDAELQHNLFLDIGASFYHFPEGPGGGAGLEDTLEPYLGLRLREIADTWLTAGGFVYFDIDKSFTVETFLEYNIPFEGGIPASLDLGAYIGYTDEDRRFEEDHPYYGVSAEVPYALNEVATITGGVHYAGRSNLEDTPREEDRDFFYWTAGVNLQY